MSSATASKAWMLAASIGAVEALNYALRSIHQHAKTRVRTISQAKNLSSSVMSSTKLKEVKAKQSEESLRKVMYLSCWGPN